VNVKLGIYLFNLLLPDRGIYWNGDMRSALSGIRFNGFKMEEEEGECLEIAIRIFKAIRTSWYLLVLVIWGGDTFPIPFPYGYPWVGVKKCAVCLRSPSSLTPVWVLMDMNWF